MARIYFEEVKLKLLQVFAIIGSVFLSDLNRGLNMSNLSVSKVYQLGLMTAAYIVGELTHFLINTTSKAQVRDREETLNHN